jgi:hypothetical protein
VRDRIDNSHALIAILHRKTGSPCGSRWVDQEIAYAMGRHKQLLWLVEDGLKLTGMEGDLEYLPFTRSGGKLSAENQFYKRLKEYAHSAASNIAQNGLYFPETVYANPDRVGFSTNIMLARRSLITSGIGLLPITDTCHPQVVERLVRDREFTVRIVLSDPQHKSVRQRAVDEKDDPSHLAKDVAKIAIRYLCDDRLTEAIRQKRLLIQFSSIYPTDRRTRRRSFIDSPPKGVVFEANHAAGAEECHGRLTAMDSPHDTIFFDKLLEVRWLGV